MGSRVCAGFRDELQVLFSKRAHGDAITGDPPCSGPRQKCQSTTLQNQRNSFLCARDVMQLQRADLCLCRRVFLQSRTCTD